MFHKLTASYWSSEGRRGFVGLIAGLILAPVIVALGISGMVFIIHSQTEAEMATAIANTMAAAQGLVMNLALFTATLGLAAVLLAWSLRARAALLWCLIGALAGLIWGLLRAPSADVGVVYMGAVAGMGMAILLIVRGVAGIRNDQAEAAE
jgi:hypothetical protein